MVQILLFWMGFSTIPGGENRSSEASPDMGAQHRANLRGVQRYLEDEKPDLGDFWLVKKGKPSHSYLDQYSTLLRGLTNHGYWPLTKWDDPPRSLMIHL